jgi:hypothetical protein
MTDYGAPSGSYDAIPETPPPLRRLGPLSRSGSDSPVNGPDRDARVAAPSLGGVSSSRDGL